jgi:RNA polymerase sigma-70 factor, ECF subfamily
MMGSSISPDGRRGGASGAAKFPLNVFTPPAVFVSVGPGIAEIAETVVTEKRPLTFEQAFTMHERMVYRTALRLLGRPEDAQDAAQEVFLRLHRHWWRLRSRADVAPWLYRVTVNVCRDIGRKRHAEVPVEEAGLAEAPSADPERAQRASLLERALARLPEKERLALVLREMEGLATSEVAAALGSAEGTVRSQISRARLRLREMLKGRL